jgi:hypothetical protein
MSPALATDGTSGFVVLLAVLLAAMLVAVIRAPRWDGSPSEDAEEDAARPPPAAPASSRSVPAPFRPADAQARAAAAIARAAAVLPATPAPDPQPGEAATTPLPAVATGQPGHGRYPVRHVTGTLPRPQVSGGPPWGPAPKPPGPQAGRGPTSP